MEGITLNGSLLYGFAVGVSGFLFAAIAAVFSQIASNSKGAISFSFMTLGILYLVRAIGDVGTEVLSYISPLGLILRTEIFFSNNWLPIWIILGISLMLYILAFYLNAMRDLGAGLVAAKPGRREASKFLQTPMGFTLKLLKGTIIGWGITIFLAGVSYGAIYGDIETFLAGNEMLQQIFLNNADFTIAEQFTTTLMVIMSVLITIPTLICLLRLRGEEKKERLEQIYSKQVSRKQMIINYLIVAVASSIDFMLLLVIGLWGSAAIVMSEPMSFMSVLTAGLVYLPAIWLMIGLTTMLIAYLPKLTSLIWGLLGVSFFFAYLGGMLDLPAWVYNLIPFTVIPQIPVEQMNWLPIIILTIIAKLMMIIGVYGYNKRDLIQG